jgi:ABC-type Fe3+/spermidine/putrescine transport system ATPase subunit
MYDYLAKIILLGPSGCGKYFVPTSTLSEPS